MADNECMVENSGGSKIEEFSRKNTFETSSVKCKNGIRMNSDCDNDFRPCLTLDCAVKLTDCVTGNGTVSMSMAVGGIVLGCSAPTPTAPSSSSLSSSAPPPPPPPPQSHCAPSTLSSIKGPSMKQQQGKTTDIRRFGSSDTTVTVVQTVLVNDRNRTCISTTTTTNGPSMDTRNNNNNNKRRTLRFDSSESSDSGVAALSNTDSSQSSGTSDITEPCSPSSPASSSSSSSSSSSPSSCTSLPSDRIHINGYDATSPPSCQGSYDSGLEEATISSSHSPQTPIRSPEDDHDKDDVSLSCNHSEADDRTSSSSSSSSLSSNVIETTSSLDLEGVSSVVSDHFATTDRNVRLLGRRDWFAMPDTKSESFDNNGSNTTTSTILSHFQNQWNGSSVANETIGTSGCSSLSSTKQFPLPPPSSRVHLLTKTERRGGGVGVKGGGVGSNVSSDPLMRCHWSKCGQVLSCGGDIVDHIRSCHVDAQVNSESFVCLWEGCKVYNKASCSLSWLERHVLTHSGNKPFKCIVDGCGQRFTSQTILERHVNSHFNHPQSHSSNVAKRKDDTPTKLMKKKRLRYRRTALTARKDDFFDSGIMECLRHQLMVFNDQTRLDLERSGSSITFHSTVIARQIELTGKPRVLLHWVPENIIPDEWVYECQVESRSKQTISLSKLPRDKLRALHPSSPSVGIRQYRKNRRK